MLIDLKQKAQVTIPSALVKKLKLSIGDKLQVEEKEGKIVLTPVSIIPKDQMWFYSKAWQAKEREVELQVAEGKIHEAQNGEELFEDLGLNDED